MQFTSASVALLAHLRHQPKSEERVAVRSGGRTVLLRLAEIDWIEAADDCVNLHLGQQCHRLREPMNQLEARLSCTRFIRISRTAMVNIEHIKELQPMFHGEYVVILRNGARLTLTRAYRERLHQISFV